MSSSVRTYDVVVVGGGHAGLVLSCLLQDARRDHVVLEAGRVLEQWRSARWDSFKLNTPMFCSRLPGQKDDLPDTDLNIPFERVLSSWLDHVKQRELPVFEHTRVASVSQKAPDGAIHDESSEGKWLYVTAIEETPSGTKESIIRARNVVACSGFNAGRGHVPQISKQLPEDIHQVRVGEYRCAEVLPEGGVLVVGSAQSGTQISEDLSRAGREVYLATSLVKGTPRMYRGEDHFVWFDRMGFLGLPTEAIPDPAMKTAPNPFTGAVRPISPHSLARDGVRLMGHLKDFDAATPGRLTARFANDLKDNIAFAEEGYKGVKGMIEGWVQANWSDSFGEIDFEEEWEEHRPLTEAINSGAVPTELDMRSLGIRTVIWATGFEPDLRWVPESVVKTLDPVTGRPPECLKSSAVEGFFFLGFPCLRTIMSANLCGLQPDAEALLSLLRSPPKEE